jgi:hypothetical protein
VWLESLGERAIVVGRRALRGRQPREDRARGYFSAALRSVRAT